MGQLNIEFNDSLGSIGCAAKCALGLVLRVHVQYQFSLVMYIVQCFL